MDENLIEHKPEIDDLASFSQGESKEIRIRTSVPMLKMPGHTGFLTFATVPPLLSSKLSASVPNKTNISSILSLDKEDCFEENLLPKNVIGTRCDEIKWYIYIFSNYFSFPFRFLKLSRMRMNWLR